MLVTITTTSINFKIELDVGGMKIPEMFSYNMTIDVNS